MERSSASRSKRSEVADGVREIYQPTFVGPSFGLREIHHRVDKVRGAPPGFERGLEVGQKLLLHIKDELNLFAGLLLEGGDDLPDRRILLRVLSLFPPHHEVSGPGAGRRNREHGDHKRSSATHFVTSPMGRPAVSSRFRVPGNTRAKPT
jgi:hypothetical protein